jgi:hypothetical protein
MRDWRVQHYRATFANIEEELDTRMARLRAGLLEDLAIAKGCTKSQAVRFPLCLMNGGSFCLGDESA